LGIFGRHQDEKVGEARPYVYKQQNESYEFHEKNEYRAAGVVGV
jgi:hypothetical protein